MGDKAKGRDNGKAAQKKKAAPKTGKHGLRPHEERARQEGMVRKPG
jgi:hypothetical protein